MSASLDRRSLLALGLAALLPVPALAAGPETVVIPVQDRKVELTVWRPAKVLGVILFSHGGNGSPDRYAPLAGFWRDFGFLVVAPLHTDSLKNTAAADHGLQAAFGTRIADLAAAGGWASAAAPGKPIAVAGHSYGSLTAMVRGGALESMLHAGDPALKAVIAFSTPGKIPGLIGPNAFSTLTAPLLTFTGDQDIVPGFVTDWRDHLAAFETAPAGANIAWIGKGVSHTLAGRELSDNALGEAAALSLLFLSAHVLGDPASKTLLAEAASSEVAEIRRR